MDVELHLLEAEPSIEGERWEDIQEGDLATDTGSIRLTGGYEAKNYIPGGNGGLTPTGPSLHRLRVSANGRGLNYDLVTSDSDTPESYLIEIWPASDPSNSTVIKHESGR